MTSWAPPTAAIFRRWCLPFSRTSPFSEKAIPGHTEEFKAAACSAYGLATIARGAKALALTALELIQNPEELAAIKAEHAQKIAEQ